LRIVLERSEALVLRAVDFSQTSRIVTFLCPDRGRMACMVKGVRRPRSAIAGMLDKFHLLEIVYVWNDSRRVQQLTDCSLLQAYGGLRDDLDKSMFAAVPLEIVDTVAHDNEPSRELYAALVSGLEGLDKWAGDVRSYVSWFMLRLLAASGFAPAVQSCYSCGGEVSSAPGFAYAGGVTCKRCASDRRLSSQDYIALSAFSENKEGCPAPEVDAGLFQILTRYASHQIERDLRSARVLDQMFGSAAGARHGGRQ